MNRRDSLKYLFAASGSLVALPSWAEGWTSKGLTHLSSFTSAEQEVLASVVDTIIPASPSSSSGASEAGNRIGALSVGVDKFIQKLIDNCYEPDVRKKVKEQLAALNGFPQLGQKEREARLLSLEASSVDAEKDFFRLMKSETIRGFNTSKEVMLNHLKYKIAPDHYYGCVDVKA